MNTFVYSPLPTKHHFRLLSLGTGSDELVGSLSTYGLNEELDFLALSYAWGPPSSTIAFPCSGKILPVHQNLHAALQTLGAKRFQKPIWIDALCINQDDEVEKNHQVPLMRHIFGRASTVLIWLGSASRLEEDAFTALPGIVATLDRADPSLALWKGHHHPSEQMAALYAKLGLPAAKSPIWPTLWDILSRSWFKRLWVLQEVALAKHIQVLCGSTTADWDVLVKLREMIYKHRLYMLVSNGLEVETEESREGFDLLHGLWLCRYWLSKMAEANMHDGGVFIPHLLGLLRLRDATNSRDKVYGVLGLVAKPIRDAIVVDYSLTPAQFYADFARLWAPWDADLSLLSEVGGTGTSELDGLPSWCPNFNTRGLLTRLGGQSGQLSGCHAGFRKPFQPKSGIIKPINSNIITVPGFVVDRVAAKVEERRPTYPLTPEGARVILNWDQECLELARRTYRVLVEIPLPYPRTLIAQRIADVDGTPRQSIPDCTEFYKEWRGFLQNLAQPGNKELASTNTMYYANNVGNLCLGRAFFATDAGRIGLGPSHLRLGDLVCIFDNSPVPFLIRYRAPNSPTMLVGEAYVDGLMYGEALEMKDMGLVEFVRIPIA